MTAPVTVSVREAVPADGPALASLYGEGRSGIEGQRGAAIDTLLHARPEPVVGSFEADIDSDVHCTLLASVDGLEVGYLSLDLSTASGELATVTDLFVQPGARGVGAGAALLDRAVERAVAAGCTGLNARALPGDRITKNFFESFGLVARSIEVYRSLV